MKALLIGFSAARTARIAKVFRAPGVQVETVSVDGSAAHDWAASFARADAVFLNTEMGLKRLTGFVERARKARTGLPIVLTYGDEPTGRHFEIARRYDCWLFSEADRLARGLTAREIADALEARESEETRSRLVDVSLCSGPCSTGD